MRFDLTCASCRVLKRAGEMLLPRESSKTAEISSEKLLHALFEEDECHAARWMFDAGLTSKDIPDGTLSSDTQLYHSEDDRSEFQFYLDDHRVRVERLTFDMASVFAGILLNCGRRDGPILSMTLNTEHLLLAVSMDGGNVGYWLREHGFEPTELSERIVSMQSPVSQNTIEPEPNPIELGKDFFNDFFSENALPLEPTRSTKSKFFSGTWRLLDAAANRAREAVRVIEDYVRFILDDREQTRALKNFRHEFQNILEIFSTADRLRHRDTEQDVGTVLEGSGEYVRQSPLDVLSANFARLQESLRSLEEFSKIDLPAISKRLEQLRYRSYTLQKNVFLVAEEHLAELPPVRENPLASAKLYVLVDVRSDVKAFRTLVRALIDGGVDVIQLRDKKADDRTLLERSRILRDELNHSERKVLFIMNDRPDLARLAEADGVHVGQEELSVHDVRKIVGDEMLVGVSTHRIEQAEQAVADGADYIGVGPVFPSSTKSFDEFAGLDYIKEVAEKVSIPAFAIGGITDKNIFDVLATGIRRVAVGSAIIDSGSPRMVSDNIVHIISAETIR